MSPIYESDADDIERRKNGAKPRPKGKIPHPPSREEPLSEVRQWLSDAAGLPPEVRIEVVIRSGTEPEDPLTVVLSNKIQMRCPHQSRLQQARTLQAFLASASDGIAMPPYLGPAEVGDFYTALCRMSAAVAHPNSVADLRERLAQYVGLCEPLHGSIHRSQRYTTLEAMKARPSFDRSSIEGRAPDRPVVLLDGVEKRRYIRASEWVAWLRFAQGRTVDESGLPALMTELNSERVDPQAWNSDRSHKVHLVLYSLPEDV